MNQNRVFIFGSCVSRDTFEHFDPAEFTLLHYVARQSALSAYTRPVTQATPPTFTSPFKQRMVAGDFDSNLRDLMRSAADDVDLLLVDLVDERLGVYILPDGSVVTRSVELIQSGWEQTLPQGALYLPFGSEKHFEYWADAIEYLGKFVQQLMPRAAVALLDLPWAELTESGGPAPDSFGVTAREANVLYRRYIDAAQDALGARTISIPSTDVRAAENHPWGPAPFHYTESVYLQLVQLLTGAEGRAIWTSTPSHSSASPRSKTTDRPLQVREEFTIDRLVRTTWRMRRREGTHSVYPIRLEPSGAIWGTSHKNESAWALHEGHLIFKTDTGSVSTRFDIVYGDHNSPVLEGPFLLDPNAGITHVLEAVSFDAAILNSNPELTRNQLREELGREGWRIGDHTIGRPQVYTRGPADLSVGKFCTFEPGVTIILGALSPQLPASYPFHSVRQYWPSGFDAGPDLAMSGSVCIGSDVYVGAGATIMPGVTLADGAIVEAGSVVVDDVKPYGIVAGCPARETGQRFDDAFIEKLLDLRWWDWPVHEINAAIPLLTQPGIERLLESGRPGGALK